jgi:2-dehydro-3-deoxyphosphogluconate aldolase / (4S)-4-hydroxy-2-oxoglutarate aldolase
MDKSAVLQRLREIGLVPVVRAQSAEKALALSAVIADAGVPALEITMTVPDAIQVIQELAETRPNILVGAGTVLDPEMAHRCIQAGAMFVVSPGLDIKTIEMCQRHSIAVLPGALTPTEIITAWKLGADVVKVFPASAMGGASYLRSLKAPLPHIEMIPTGGVSVATAMDFLESGAFALGVGADLVNAKAMAEGRPEIITETAKKYLAILKEFRARGEQ